MRKRLTPQHRKSEILAHARQAFLRHGYARIGMEDIRKASGVSRGGLYHHFSTKGAILGAIIAGEVHELAEVLDHSEGQPIVRLLEEGSSRPGETPGILKAIDETEDRLTYLSHLDREIARQLGPPLGERLSGWVHPDVDPRHVAELFLTINAHINRRLCLGEWTQGQAAGFTATALRALTPFLRDATRISKIIQRYESQASAS